MRRIRQFVLATGLGLLLAGTSMGFGDGFGPGTAHARMTPRLRAYTIGDMRPGSCLYQGSGWYICMGPDDRSYGCKSTGSCVKLGN
jgi:hypothetical protein